MGLAQAVTPTTDVPWKEEDSTGLAIPNDAKPRIEDVYTALSIVVDAGPVLKQDTEIEGHRLFSMSLSGRGEQNLEVPLLNAILKAIGVKFTFSIRNEKKFLLFNDWSDYSVNRKPDSEWPHLYSIYAAYLLCARYSRISEDTLGVLPYDLRNNRIIHSITLGKAFSFFNIKVERPEKSEKDYLMYIKGENIPKLKQIYNSKERIAEYGEWFKDRLLSAGILPPRQQSPLRQHQEPR